MVSFQVAVLVGVGFPGVFFLGDGASHGEEGDEQHDKELSAQTQHENHRDTQATIVSLLAEGNIYRALQVSAIGLVEKYNVN